MIVVILVFLLDGATEFVNNQPDLGACRASGEASVEDYEMMGYSADRTQAICLEVEVAVRAAGA